MRLVSRKAQQVEIPRADLVVTFAEGEYIWTESSYKYTAEDVTARGRRAGFRTIEQWIDGRARFALTLFAAE